MDVDAVVAGPWEVVSLIAMLIFAQVTVGVSRGVTVVATLVMEVMARRGMGMEGSVVVTLSNLLKYKEVRLPLEHLKTIIGEIHTTDRSRIYMKSRIIRQLKRYHQTNSNCRRPRF